MHHKELHVGTHFKRLLGASAVQLVWLNDHKARMLHHSTLSIIKTVLPCEFVSRNAQSLQPPPLKQFTPLGPPTSHTHK